MNRKIIVICGPTGSGKTDLALRLAAARPTSIISADSRQVYQGLDILTGKDIPEDFRKENDYYTDGKTRIFGLDLVSPADTMSAGEFSKYARAVIGRETEEGRQVIVVGGTGFYLTALTRPEILSPVPPNQTLRRKLNDLSIESLQKKLKDLDPVRFSLMNRSDVPNPRRLIRAIEIALFAPTPPISTEPVPEAVWVGLRLPLMEMEKRIKGRVAHRVESGALNEVKRLLADYPDQTLPVYTTLGVQEITSFLRDEIGREELVSRWAAAELAYAKRQLTWFKKQDQIIWYDQNEVGKLTLPIIYEKSSQSYH